MAQKVETFISSAAQPGCGDLSLFFLARRSTPCSNQAEVFRRKFTAASFD